MTPSEYIKWQKELKQSLLPDHLQSLISIRDQFKPAIEIPNVAAEFKSAITISELAPFKSAISDWYKFITAFREIETTHSNEIFEPIGY